MVNKNKTILESQKELYQDLKQYEWLLSRESYEYLESLLALEISAFNKEFDNDSREILRKFEVYKRIVIYNICNRTKNLLLNNGNGIEISTVENYEHPVEFSIFGKINGKIINSFRFNIEEDNLYYIPLYIGDAIIYSSCPNRILRQEEIKKLTKEYKAKLKQDNPHARHDGVKRFQDENGSKWETSRQADLEIINKKLTSLKNFSLDNTTKELIAAQNYLAGLILDDMHLKDEDFTTSYQNGLEKTLVRKYPDMSVKHNIKNL